MLRQSEARMLRVLRNYVEACKRNELNYTHLSFITVTFESERRNASWLEAAAVLRRNENTAKTHRKQHSGRPGSGGLAEIDPKYFMEAT